MMGKQGDKQAPLFYPGFSFEKRIPSDHLLRKISKHIDFTFAYNEVKEKYGNKGNVSVPPPIILKMMLLLILYNISSERQLMRDLPLRLDWMWFLGYDLGDYIPNHSVLSKARKRWGVKVFKKLFERIVYQCVKAGLVDGRKLFMDSSLISANASDDSIINREILDKHYLELESRLSGKDCYSIEDQSKKENTKDTNKRF
jgi:transposase